MIYLANNEIIKQPELIQDLPSLSLPVLDGVETGATIVLGTQLSVSNMPTGATLYVNGSAVQGSTFTITPDASASTRNYLYTINLQFKGVSGYEDSEIASYSFTVKNAAPTVNQNSQVTTSASLTVAISRTDTTYVSDLDVKYGVGTDTITGNSGTSVTVTDTSVNSQYNFWCDATSYADKSDIVTKYYHVAGSEKLPTPTISYDETNENFTINIASFPSDPDNGNYMSSTGYTIYYSLNSETIDTQYNNIAVSCNVGDTIRAKVSSAYGWQDSDVDVYEVESSIPISISFDKATYNINKGYTTSVNNMGFSAFTVTDNLGNDVTDDVVLSSANGMIIYANNKHLIPITSGTDTITATYTPSGATALTTTCTVNSKNKTNIYNYGSVAENTLPITISDANTHDYQIKIVDNNNNEGYFGTITVTNVSSSNSSVMTASVLSGGAGFTVQGVSAGNATITITFTASNVGTCTYPAQFIYSAPAPTFSDNYAFQNVESEDISDDGDGIEVIENSGANFIVYDTINEEKVIPDSAPTCSSSDSTVATIEWTQESEFSIAGVSEGTATLSMSITIDVTTYNTTLDVTVSAAEPETTSIAFNTSTATGNLPTSSSSSGEGTLSSDYVEIYCDNWYISGGQYRTQNGATIIRITGTTNFITQIEFDAVEGYGCSNMALSSGIGSFDDTDAPNGVYTGNGADTTIEFALSNRVRFTEIRVYLGDEIPEPEPIRELWFDCEEGLEDVVGSEIEAGLYFGVRDSGEEVEVNDSENCTLSSNDESVATVEWYDQNEGEDEPLYVPKFTCVGEGECTISAEYTVDGATYYASFALTVTAAE